MKRYSSIKEAIRDLTGKNREIIQYRPVSGGDINDAYCLILSDGEKLFLKMNPSADRSFFQAEADGLAAISSTHTVKTPEVLACGREGRSEFLLMEWIQTERRRPHDYWEKLGRQLAEMHRADTAGIPEHGICLRMKCRTAGGETGGKERGQFGFFEDNYIGRNPQKNSPCDHWIEFFRDNRLIPQARMADKYFDATDRKRMIFLLDHLEEYLTEPEFPSLLHGDLWGGNVITGNDGYAWLIDPAVYVGHAEADLAMTELFGGFSGTFYRAYQEINPLQPGYGDRRDLYNLYHLLNHTNLFGWTYYSSVREILKRYV